VEESIELGSSTIKAQKSHAIIFRGFNRGAEPPFIVDTCADRQAWARESEPGVVVPPPDE
jgi:hypothetical protein